MDNDGKKKGKELGDKCAKKIPADWKHAYMRLVTLILKRNETIPGSLFRVFCKSSGLRAPYGKHNWWASMTLEMQREGLITPIGKTAEKDNGNHMDTVTLWKSMIYEPR